MDESKQDELNLDRYHKQFDALMVALREMKRMYAGLPDSNFFGRKNVISELLGDLESFATGQFYFFYHGFKGDKTQEGIPHLFPEVSTTNKTIEYPVEHVLAQTLTQISEDLITIRLAAEQRSSTLIEGRELEGSHAAKLRPSTDILANAALASGDESDQSPVTLLPATDKLANAALAFARSSETASTNQSNITIPLSYLTDGVRIRVMPYYPVGLIGITYKATQDFHTFMAIPHEVGHFCFWFSGRAKEYELEVLGHRWKGFEDCLLNLRELYYPFKSTSYEPAWNEEIFADVYGTLVGGPLAVLTAMDLALETTRKMLYEFDMGDTHPSPLIRPLLMIKALNAMNTPLVKSADPLLHIDSEKVEKYTIQLFNRWKRLLEKRNILKAQNDDGEVDADWKDLEAEFIDCDLAAKVAGIVDWQSRYLNHDFVVERMVQDAVNALTHFLIPRRGPCVDWGWSDTILRHDKHIDELYDEATAIIAELIETPDVPLYEGKGEASLSEEEGLAFANVPEEFLPSLWKKWVTEKRYFSKELKSEIWAGEFDAVMQPYSRPTDTWLPVFAAGGWTTGPCGSPKRIEPKQASIS